MPVKIRDVVTGEVTQREVVDAREILKMRQKSGALRYEQVPINEGPQNVEHVVEEFKREPVGSNVPKPPTDEDEVVKIRNPVSDQPRMARQPQAGVAGQMGVAFDRDTEKELLESQTVAELKETASNEGIELGEAHLKADIIKTMLRHRAKAAKEAEGGAEE
jgi:hypothetical protein